MEIIVFVCSNLSEGCLKYLQKVLISALANLEVTLGEEAIGITHKQYKANNP